MFFLEATGLFLRSLFSNLSSFLFLFLFHKQTQQQKKKMAYIPERYRKKGTVGPLIYRAGSSFVMGSLVGGAVGCVLG